MWILKATSSRRKRSGSAYGSPRVMGYIEMKKSYRNAADHESNPNQVPPCLSGSIVEPGLSVSRLDNSGKV